MLCACQPETHQPGHCPAATCPVLPFQHTNLSLLQFSVPAKATGMYVLLSLSCLP